MVLGHNAGVRCLTIAAALALLACEPGPGTLLVELRTDLTPGLEIDTALTALDPGGAVAATPLDAGGTLRVAEVPDLAPGRYRLSVTVTKDGEAVATRTVVFRHDGPRVLTVVIPRSCAGVTCDERVETCIRGACGSVECVDGSEASCPAAECVASADCAPVASCADARCVGGTCVAETRPDACAAPATCSVTDGCVGAGPTDPPVLRLECAGGGVENAEGGLPVLCEGDRCPTFDAVGPLGAACRFDGGDVVRVPGLDLGTREFTFAAYVEPSAPLADGETRTLLRRPFADAGASTFRLWLAGRMDGTALGHGADSRNVTSSLTPLPAAWPHVAVVMRSGELSVWLNGVQPGSGTFGGQNADASAVLIGARDAMGLEAFDGWLADLRVYDRALEPDEIASLAAR